MREKLIQQLLQMLMEMPDGDDAPSEMPKEGEPKEGHLEMLAVGGKPMPGKKDEEMC
jgi:hypothetical protein